MFITYPLKSQVIPISSIPFDEYTDMYIETAITCVGNTDQNCSPWDHTVTLTVTCVDTAVYSSTESSTIHFERDYSVKNFQPDNSELLHGKAFSGFGAHHSRDVDLDYFHLKSKAHIHSSPASYYEMIGEQVPVIHYNRKALITRDSRKLILSFKQSLRESNPLKSKALGIMQKSKVTRRLEEGGAANEIARYVTPYSRRVGHWLTYGTPFIPLITQNGTCDAVQFSVTDGGQKWYIETNLHFYGSTKLSSTDVIPTQIATLYHIFSSLTTSYNQGRDLQLIVPSESVSSFIEVIVTGHGQDSNTGNFICMLSLSLLMRLMVMKDAASLCQPCTFSL